MISITNIRAKSLRNGLFAAVSVIALSGCVTAVSDQIDQAAVQNAAPQVANTDATSVSDADEVAQNAPQNEADAAEEAAPSVAQAIDPSTKMEGLVTQPTAIAATQNSIFAVANAPSSQGEGAAGSVPAFVPVPVANPAVKSLYQQDRTAAAQQAENAPAQSAKEVSSAAEQTITSAAPRPQARSGESANSLTLAAFFAAAAKKGGSSNNAKAPVASFSGDYGRDPIGIALAGRSSMSEQFDDEYDEEEAEETKPAGLMKLASLGSLSRVSPNGLHLQTDYVSVGCMKPELVRRIKAIESHYNSPAIVTSGFRPRKSNVRRGSLHHSCEAADIQVKGVSKWELAKYLRAQPDRGGVGTYCHTESVHLDLGEARDWNWRCRAKAKNS